MTQRGQCVERRSLLLYFIKDGMLYHAGAYGEALDLVGSEDTTHTKAFIGIYVGKEKREVGISWEWLVWIMSENSKPQTPPQLFDN